MNTAQQNLLLLQEIEANRQFLLDIYQQNPALLKKTESRIQSLFQPLPECAESPKAPRFPSASQRGISLIELIIFIVILSVALTGILLVMNQVTAHSADPLIHKQAIAAAESLLEEIELQDFISASGVTNAVTQANRASEYHIVNDYNGFATTGIYPMSGVAPIPGLENYHASVAITGEALNGIAAGSAVRITVTVTTPQNESIVIDGYRTAY